MNGGLVLCYHAVSEYWDAPLSVTPAALERQLTALVRLGYRGVTFREVVLAESRGRRLAVTFDDAFRSVIDRARPILASLGLPGTVFAPTAFMDDPRPLAWHGIDHWGATEHAGELSAMTWDDLVALAAQGWEIGSHTRSHPHLPRLEDDELAEELKRSRERIADRLGRCDTIAYPYGDVDERVGAAAAAAGYAAGAALSRRLEQLGPLRYPRVGVYHDDSFWRFAAKASSLSRRLRAHAPRPAA